jgi:hypothetical protein
VCSYEEIDDPQLHEELISRIKEEHEFGFIIRVEKRYFEK